MDYLIKRISIIFLLLLFYTNIFAQTKNANTDSLFKSDEMLYITLRANFKKLRKDVKTKSKYHKAFMNITDSDGVKKNIVVNLKPRGNFRKNPKNCDFPPLKLKIKKKERKKTIFFKDQKKLKLVIPCRIKRKNYQQYIIKEYIVYKIYNELTDLSFRVRPAKIVFIDSIKPDTSAKYCFFIENPSNLAKRNNGITKKIKRVKQDKTNYKHMTLLAVFQYMIGNTDWSISTLHNTRLFFYNMQQAPYAIPYDFDNCGLIMTPYARPAPQLNISSVYTRIFRGYKRKYEDYIPIIELFNSKKENIYNIISNNNDLNKKNEKKMKKYLDNFYEIINDRKKTETEFIKNCRK